MSDRAIDGEAWAVRIEGDVEPGFEPVRDAFVENFRRGDVGAALCVYHRGRRVVDLAGGVVDPRTGAPYRRDTLQPVFSVSKGVVALAAHMLAGRGLLDLDAPVARYWPEFAKRGKEGIPVCWLLTHRAGLAAIDRPTTYQEFLDWDTVIARLEEQPPNWPPGTAFGYHSLTFGHLVGEVIRRITGVSVGRWIAREISRPLGVELFIGLPPELLPRVAPVLPPEQATGGMRFIPGSLPYRAQAFMRPPATAASLNDPALLTAEIPAANGVATAAALAKMFAATIGEVDGVRLLSAERMERARAERYRGPDLVEIRRPECAVGLGFMLPSSDRPLGGPSSFGHPGLGGSRAWALPERELAFGYVVNRLLDTTPDPDPRELALSRAVLACVPRG
jgi:CubicO group peptidase (beta-lactamase class C family)